jgi:hypothetical protein
MRQDTGYVMIQGESKYSPFDFTNDLIAGAVVLSATGLLTKPDLTTFALTDVVVSGAIVYGMVPTAQVTANGDYYLDITAIVDNAGTLTNETLKWRRHIHVPR